jgi:hypothetical protein
LTTKTRILLVLSHLQYEEIKMSKKSVIFAVTFFVILSRILFSDSMAEKGVKDDSKKEQESKLHFFLADSFMNLGNVYKAVGKYEKAELFYGKCGKHFQKAFLLKEDKKQKPETNDSPSKNNIKNNNTVKFST